MMLQKALHHKDSTLWFSVPLIKARLFRERRARK
jgi:hypothetical protein